MDDVFHFLLEFLRVEIDIFLSIELPKSIIVCWLVSTSRLLVLNFGIYSNMPFSYLFI